MDTRMASTSVLVLGLVFASGAVKAQSAVSNPSQVVTPTVSSQSSSVQADTVKETTNSRLKEKSEDEKGKKDVEKPDQKK